MKILSKIKSLRPDHELTQETDLDTVLQNIKEKDHPTLYHKQLVQKYQKYPIEEKYHIIKQKITSLDSFHTHITKLIPEQIHKSSKKIQKAEPLQKILIYMRKTRHIGLQWKLTRYPATISQPVLQLMTEWSYLNYSGYRYDILTALPSV